MIIVRITASGEHRYAILAACGVLLFLLSYGLSLAQTSTVSVDKMMCPNGEIWGPKIVSGVCWSCLFPMRVMGAAQFGAGAVPPGATRRTTCVCSGSDITPSIGFTIGMWSPYTLIELVRKPYCSPSLGGATIRKSSRLWGMVDGAHGRAKSNQFLNFHYFSYPLYQILQFVMNSDCSADGWTNFDLLYPSELDATYNNNALTLFTTPESAVAANPVLQMACPADCAKAGTDAPIKSLWWCIGCWGNLYPFVGAVPCGGSAPRVSSLLAARSIAALHRRGLAYLTMGDEALCGGKIYPMIPKEQYKMSMLFPIPEADGGVHLFKRSTRTGTGIPDIDNYQWSGKCCHNLGTSTFMWGEWRNIPAVGEDFIYMVWRWSDCCLK